MSDPNDNITDQPQEEPRRGDVTRTPRRGDEGYEPDRSGPPKKTKVWPFVLLGCGVVFLVLCVPAVLVGLLIPAVHRVRQAAARMESQNNIMQMGLAMNRISLNSPTGDIPPAYGSFPFGAPWSQSYFVSLLPYIDHADLVTPSSPGYLATASATPIRTYIAPADHRNPGTNSTISYCTNGTLLGQPNPTLPGSFNGRTASIICIMERSGLDGAHKWTDASSVLGTPGKPPPFPEIGVSSSAYSDGSPQGFTSDACIVGLGDGGARIITNSQQNAWNWACDPKQKSSAGRMVKASAAS